MKKSLLFSFSVSLILLGLFVQKVSGQTYHTLSSGKLTQDWTNTELITTNNDWSGIPSIIGYRGDEGTTATGVDPQTVLMDLSAIVNINANQTDPSTYSTGGLTEFHISDPVVGFAGSGTADAPCLVLFVNTTSCSNVKIKYDLRDLDGSADDATQAVALQYRIGGTGDFTNIPAGFVADASSGPNLSTLVTNVDVLLPSACFDQEEIQIRIITTNAAGNDEYIGIDNIVVEVDATAPVASFNPANSAVDVLVNVTPTITFDEPVRKTDGTELTDADLATLLTFKKTDASGDDVSFSATIDANKKIITVAPSATLDNSQVYYLAVGAVEDASGNESTAKSISFTTVSATTPTVTVTAPLGGEVFHAGDPATITWTSTNITSVTIEAWAREDPTTWDWNILVPSYPAMLGKLDLIIPADAMYGTEYKIRISDASNPLVSSTSGDFTIIGVATSLTDLRTRFLANDIVKISSEVTVTFLRPMNRNQKYVQDTDAGLLIDDNSGILTTVVNIGDNITGLEGKLGYYGGMLQIVPTVATVTVASSGNTVTIPEMTIPEYNTNFLQYESMLIKLKNVYFSGADGSATFAASTNYTLTDGTNELVFRTFYAGDGNIVGSVIPVSHLNLTAIAGFYNTTIQVYGRTTSDFEILTGIEKASLSDMILYPNPAASVLKVRNISNVESVEVLDLTGKVVISVNNSNDDEIQISVSELNDGMYFIRLSTHHGKVIRRFIKQ